MKGKSAQKPVEKMDAQARLAAIVIVVAAVLWVAGNLLGRQFGWDMRYAFLLDFAAIAAFLWGMVVTWRVWRRQADAGTGGSGRSRTGRDN